MICVICKSTIKENDDWRYWDNEPIHQSCFEDNSIYLENGVSIKTLIKQKREGFIMQKCIQSDLMRCICKAVSSRGEQYNPALKTVYWREGANGKFVKIGYRCPNCGVFYQLDDKKMIR